MPDTTTIFLLLAAFALGAIGAVFLYAVYVGALYFAFLLRRGRR